jgi:hypothetical protein
MTCKPVFWEKTVRYLRFESSFFEGLGGWLRGGKTRGGSVGRWNGGGGVMG